MFLLPGTLKQAFVFNRRWLVDYIKCIQSTGYHYYVGATKLSFVEAVYEYCKRCAFDA